MAFRAFKDINLSFKRHPVTNDVLTIRDEDAIKRSVRNIIFTILGEKPFEPNFGSVINQSLFELNTSLNEVRVSDEIEQSLICLLYTSPSPRDVRSSRMPSSA